MTVEEEKLFETGPVRSVEADIQKSIQQKYPSRRRVLQYLGAGVAVAGAAAAGVYDISQLPLTNSQTEGKSRSTTYSFNLAQKQAISQWRLQTGDAATQNGNNYDVERTAVDNVGTYSFSPLPLAHAETEEILDIPIAPPITLDGKWNPPEEYKMPNMEMKKADIIYYANTLSNEPPPEVKQNPGSLYFGEEKESGWTDICLDFLSDTKKGNRQIGYLLDTTGELKKFASGTPGVYNLSLGIKAPTEVFLNPPTNPIGVPLTSKDYGKLFQYKCGFGPSPNSSKDHTILEVQISTEMLTKTIGADNPNAIFGFRGDLIDSFGNVSMYPDARKQPWEKARYSGMPIPFFPPGSEPYVAGGTLGLASNLILFYQRKMSNQHKISRRELLLPFLPK